MLYQTLLNSFCDELKEYLKEIDGYLISLLSHSYIDCGYDALIKYKKIPVAAIEIVSNIVVLSSRKRYWGKVLKASQLPISIIICDKEIHVRETEDSRFKKICSIQDLSRYIVEYCSGLVTDVDKDAIKREISNRIAKYYNAECLSPAIKLFEDSLDKLITLNGKVMIGEDAEDKFFMTLLGRYDKSHLCRYTTIDNLFTTLDKCSHAMCCPVSMNDPNEGRYADSVLNYKYDISEVEQTVERDNGCYILSCTDKEQEDDLTMWRLYADDAKGVCIQYEVNKEIDRSDNYFLAKINYGERDGSHKALELLQELISEPLQKGWHFQLSRWYIWRYFFKSHVYKSENEVRLLYRPRSNENKVWYKDSNNGLFNHLVTFSIAKESDIFPLTMSKILIGPGMKSSKQNCEQIAYMIKDKNIKTTDDFKVSRSEISNYR